MHLPNILLLLLALCHASLGYAQTEPAAPAQKLKIGVKSAPPFVMKDERSGQYTGISIELWQHIAAELDVEFEYVTTDLNGLIDGLTAGELDASVAALTVTAERESVIDFSHPFHTTGLAIAVPEQGSAFISTLRRLISLEFLASLAALIGLLMLVGFLLWLVERRKNAAMFGGKPYAGIGASFWWAAVTMTTVGYGDKAPITFWGRIIALVWMFAAIIIISSFTAAIATSLTVGHLQSSVRTVNDLYDVRVGSIEDSVSGHWLEQKNISFEAQASLNDAFKKISNQSLDAVVYDKPILQYMINQHPEAHVELLPNTLLRQDYAIALPKDSQMREPINMALLKLINSADWQDILEKHLGKES